MSLYHNYHLCLLNRVGREKVGWGCGGGNVGEGQQRVREGLGGGGEDRNITGEGEGGMESRNKTQPNNEKNEKNEEMKKMKKKKKEKKKKRQ